MTNTARRPGRRNGLGLLLVMVTALAACGNADDKAQGFDAFWQIGATSFQGKPRAQCPSDPQVRAEIAGALAQVEGPVMVATAEDAGAVSLLGVPTANGRYRTWRTPSRQSLTLKDGVLTGTRGLGFDLLSSQADPSISMIRGRRSGSTPRVYNHITGDNRDVPTAVDCTISVAGPEKVVLVTGRTHATTRMEETCRGDEGLEVANTYWVAGSGQIVQSRQWVSPERGSLFLQVLRN